MATATSQDVAVSWLYSQETQGLAEGGNVLKLCLYDNWALKMSQVWQLAFGF